MNRERVPDQASLARQVPSAEVISERYITPIQMRTRLKRVRSAFVTPGIVRTESMRHMSFVLLGVGMSRETPDIWRDPVTTARK